ncbi:hypothetical protein VFMJ11_B0132 (plasmid) [Aliivibrio fischeri MJ11]|uniref:Type IV conjugative transfer system protein TraE n=2 Tax=Aliivibrio fischeri TaxID=668 RepID=B5EW75_ALIFM|nr:hypothetical protein VFMJ11_B0132 [Aliivibrio fischeri MJ11]
MKHYYTLASLLFIILSWVAVIAMNTFITQEPERVAVMKVEENGRKKIKQVPVRSTASLTDQKLINWLEEIIPTCFSFTVININSKSSYCSDKYFQKSAAQAYLNNYVDEIAPLLDSKDANIYVGLPYAPIITSSPSTKNKKFYYVVYIQTISSLVERKVTSPSSRGLRLWVAPQKHANNPNQFTIIGIRM